MKRLLYLIALGLSATNTWAIPITVSFQPSSTDVIVGDVFTVDIVANIPDAVIGWGLDVSFDSNVVNFVAAPAIGPLWFAAFTPDGDGLAGLANPFAPVSGSNILLATLTFEAILDFADSPLIASTTAGDLTEGFPLALPAIPGMFAEINFLDGAITVNPRPVVMPEPSSFGLMFLGCIWLGLLQRRKRTLVAGHSPVG